MLAGIHSARSSLWNDTPRSDLGTSLASSPTLSDAQIGTEHERVSSNESKRESVTAQDTQSTHHFAFFFDFEQFRQRFAIHNLSLLSLAQQLLLSVRANALLGALAFG